MTLTIETRPAQSFKTTRHTLPAPTEMAAFSQAKTAASAHVTSGTYVAANANLEGHQYYFVEDATGDETYTLPGGDYAVFTGESDTPQLAYNTVAHAYGAIAQDGDWNVAGNFNLESYDHGQLTAYIPVTKA